jgi:hypothetical protein
MSAQDVFALKAAHIMFASTVAGGVEAGSPATTASSSRRLYEARYFALGRLDGWHHASVAPQT